MKHLIAAACLVLGVSAAPVAYAASSGEAVTPAPAAKSTAVSKKEAVDDWSAASKSACPDGAQQGKDAACTPQQGAARTEGAPLKGVGGKTDK
jgi:hypothetical protein